MMTTVGNEFLLSLLLIVVGVALKARNSEICGNMYDESNYTDNKKKKEFRKKYLDICMKSIFTCLDPKKRSTMQHEASVWIKEIIRRREKKLEGNFGLLWKIFEKWNMVKNIW